MKKSKSSKVNEFLVLLRLKRRIRVIKNADIDSMALVDFNRISTMYNVTDWAYVYNWQNPFKSRTNAKRFNDKEYKKEILGGRLNESVK